MANHLLSKDPLPFSVTSSQSRPTINIINKLVPIFQENRRRAASAFWTPTCTRWNKIKKMNCFFVNTRQLLYKLRAHFYLVYHISEIFLYSNFRHIILMYSVLCVVVGIRRVTLDLAWVTYISWIIISFLAIQCCILLIFSILCLASINYKWLRVKILIILFYLKRGSA